MIKNKKKLIDNIQIGSDFELFLYNNTKKEYINAKPFIKGTKKRPFNFDKSNKFWRTCLDNVLAEGNIPPCTSKKQFVDSIIKVMSYINETTPHDVNLHAVPAIYMPPHQLNTRESVEIGCEVDYNAYTLEPNDVPALSDTLRSAALHVHISYTDMNLITSTELIKAMDMFLGLPSLVIEPENERRRLYGNIGSYRINPLTLEYRVLSNFFLKDQKLIGWVYNNTLAAIDFINKKTEVGYALADKVQNLFTLNNKQDIITFMNENNIKLPQ